MKAKIPNDRTTRIYGESNFGERPIYIRETSYTIYILASIPCTPHKPPHARIPLLRVNQTGGLTHQQTCCLSRVTLITSNLQKERVAIRLT